LCRHVMNTCAKDAICLCLEMALSYSSGTSIK
jgi:hypothetical protein